MLLIITTLVVVVGGSLYLFSMAMLRIVAFFPTIGRRHRHHRWDELTKRSGRH
jgi:hypothetical protein